MGVEGGSDGTLDETGVLSMLSAIELDVSSLKSERAQALQALLTVFPEQEPPQEVKKLVLAFQNALNALADEDENGTGRVRASVTSAGLYYEAGRAKDARDALRDALEQAVYLWPEMIRPIEALKNSIK